MTPAATDTTDTPLERAHAELVAAINAQTPGGEARFLARLVLLLLRELQFSESALRLIQVARNAPD